MGDFSEAGATRYIGLGGDLLHGCLAIAASAAEDLAGGIKDALMCLLGALLWQRNAGHDVPSDEPFTYRRVLNPLICLFFTLAASADCHRQPWKRLESSVTDFRMIHFMWGFNFVASGSKP